MNTIDQLFPEPTLNRVRQLGADFSRNYWLAGDLSGYLTAYAHEHALPLTEEDIFIYLGEQWSVAGRTVRYWRDVARRFPDAMRQEYAVLPFGHFYFASQYPGFEQDILEIAVRRMDDIGGRVPSLAWLRSECRDIYRPAPQADDIPEPTESASPAYHAEVESMLPDEPPGSPQSHVNKEQIVNRMAQALGALYDGLEALELDRDEKDELHRAIDNLGQVIARIGKRQVAIAR
jgi:hypothetical protein